MTVGLPQPEGEQAVGIISSLAAVTLHSHTPPGPFAAIIERKTNYVTFL